MLFDKVLRAFETGGYTYLDFRLRLTQLLAKGASPNELIETLRRRERVEPLPAYAHEEVLRLLNEAAETARLNGQGSDVSVGEAPERSVASIQAVAPPVEPDVGVDSGRAIQEPLARQSAEYEILARAYERTKEVQNAASERVTALAAALALATRSLEAEQNKTRELGKALAERTESAEDFQSRAEALQRQAQDYVGELRAARESLIAGEAELIEIRQDHAALIHELEQRDRSAAQAAAELAAAHEAADALTADLTDARAWLETEQRKSDVLEQARAEQSAAAISLRSESQTNLRNAERHEAEVRTLRGALADRDARLALLQQEQANALFDQHAHQKSGMQVQAELCAARARADGLLVDLNSSRGAAASLDAQVKRAKFDLEAARAELAAVKAQAHSYFDLLRTREWRRASEHGMDQDFDEGAHDVNLESHSRIEQPLLVAPRPSFPTLRVIALFAVGLIVALVVWLWTRNHPREAPPAVSSEPSFQPGTVIHDCSTCPEMMVLPAGTFRQGANPAESSSAFDKPLHLVRIAHPFAMSMNAVTRDEFDAFVAATGRDMQGCDTYDGAWKYMATASWKSPGFAQSGAHPVTCASWSDAQAYASWISTKAGHRYRLPSASEWEYAARSGAPATAPWSSPAEACENANVADQSAAQHYPGWSVFGCNDGWVYTAPVGSFKANAFGLKDMLGNVFQWTQDCWNPDYAKAPIDGSARTDGDCAQREMRGGSWFSYPGYVRSSYRNHFAPDYRTSTVGIRLVREVDR